MILSIIYIIFNFVGALALLLWGMDLLSSGIQKGAGNKLQKLLSVVSGNRFTAVFTGLLVTGIIQSSSATTVMVVSFVNAQILSLTQAIGIIFGANIGTTIDAVLSSIGASTNAKRAAAVHVGFNICGTIIAIICFNPFLSLVDLIVPGTPESNITNHIAMLHTVFNICSTLIFLPFVNQIAMLVSKLIKEPKSQVEKKYKLPLIITQNRYTIDSYILQIEKEIALMSAKTMTMLDEIYTALKGFDLGFITNPKNGRVKGLKVVSLDRTYLNSIENISSQVLEQEDYIDQMNEAISDFLMNCYQMNDVSEHNKAKISKLIQITAEIEDLSDECASIIHVLQKYILTSDQKKSSSYEKLLPFVDQVKEFFDYISQHLSFGLSYTLSSEEKRLSVKMEESIDTTKKQLKKLARQRIENGKDVKSELHYIDLVRHIERAGDNVYKIAQTL